MAEGQKRSYAFESTTPVDFNVHYHVDEEVFYPVQEQGVKQGDNVFVAEEGREYCWMWENKQNYAVYLVYKVDDEIDNR